MNTSEGIITCFPSKICSSSNINRLAEPFLPSSDPFPRIILPFSMAAYLGSYLLAPLVKEALSSTGITSTTGQQIEGTLANAQRTLRTAEEAANQVRSLLDNPGTGLSGQPTIPRGIYTQVCNQDISGLSYKKKYLLLNKMPFDRETLKAIAQTRLGACSFLWQDLPIPPRRGPI